MKKATFFTNPFSVAKKAVALLSAVALVATPVFIIIHQVNAAGTAYYVDSAITDTNPASGTPDCTNYNPATFTCSGGSASAYKTIADVNAGSFSPDDQILFRKGQTWREALTIPYFRHLRSSDYLLSVWKRE